MADSPTPSEVMLETTRTTLRVGRLTPAEVIRRQLDALDAAGYRLEPDLDDGGEALMLKAAKRAIRTGHLAPGVVIARQLAAMGDAGYSFVGGDNGNQHPCEAYEWGPDSFEACARCGISYWRHPGGAHPTKGAHRA